MTRKRKERQGELLAKPTKAEMIARKLALREAEGLKRCVVYVPEDCKERLSRYVETRLGGEYKPR